jgi:hypothetical protein
VKTIEIMGMPQWHLAGKEELVGRTLVRLCKRCIDNIRQTPLDEIMRNSTFLDEVCKVTPYAASVRRSRSRSVADRKVSWLANGICSFLRSWPEGEISKQVSEGCNTMSISTANGDKVIVRERGKIIRKKISTTIDLTRRPSELRLGQAAIESAIGIAILRLSTTTAERLQSMTFAQVLENHQHYDEVMRALYPIGRILWRYNLNGILEVKNEMIPLILERLSSFPKGQIVHIRQSQYIFCGIVEGNRLLVMVRNWGDSQ